MRVRIEHLFGRLKNRWRWLMYTSRLKSGAKNIAIIDSILILNNICIEASDNHNIKQYLDTEEQEQVTVNQITSSETDDAIGDRNTELGKGKERRQEILNGLKRRGILITRVNQS